jgi:Ca2+-binding EF-hand superfamily protein
MKTLTQKLLPVALIVGVLGWAPCASAQDEKIDVLKALDLRVQRENALPKMEKPIAPAEAAKGQQQAATDAVNLVFLGEKKPVLVRFNILLDGKSVQKCWSEYIEKWFRYLDADNQGFVTEEQLKIAPNEQSMRTMMQQGGFFPGRANTFNLTLASFGKKPGEKVSLEEFQAYYRKLVPSVQVIPQYNNDATLAAAGTALFQILDLNKDGKLSKDEILAAAKTLRKLDLDDDEWITVQELVPSMNFSNNQGFGFQGGGMNGVGNSRINDAFFEIRPGDNRLGQTLLERYDRAKVQRLTQKDLGLDKKTFAKLDKNSDGSLDREELDRWHDRPADLEFTIQVGENQGVKLEKGRKAFLPAVTETGGVHQVSLEDVQINLAGVSQANPREGFVVGRQGSPYLQFFRQADVKKQGFIELKDLEAAQFVFLRQNFTLLDRDQDGKLTQKEVQAFSDLQAGATSCFVTLSLADHGRALFQLLDVNRDGRLSQRELLNAWSRMESLDKDKKGFIAPTDLARQFQIGARRGPANNGNFEGLVFLADGTVNPGRPVRAPKLPEGTPEWFRKMDRNGDGDVSLAEFLGSREEFDRIDTDRDGLISAEEAIRYDAMARKPK